MRTKNLGLLFLLTSSSIASPSPLSKITIKSNTMECAILSEKKGNVFDYQGNVAVTFADNSTINADNLVVVLNPSKKTIQPKKASSIEKKSVIPPIVASIKMSGNIIVRSNEDVVTADRAEIAALSNVCVVSGNVKVNHGKKKPTDIGVTVASSQATINLETKEITFSGEAAAPVSTVLNLDNYTIGKKTSKKQGNKNGKNQNSAGT